MSNTLAEIAQQLSTAKTVKRHVPVTTQEVEEARPLPKVQLIYAFNGTGKTRLSRAFNQLVAPKEEDEEEDAKLKMLYYNDYTEDLFYWDNDLDADVNRNLSVRPNKFTNLVLEFLKDQGQDGNIAANFQH